MRNQQQSSIMPAALLIDTVHFLDSQRAEARRRAEPEVYAQFHLMTGVQSDMFRAIIMPGLGIISSPVMREALRRVPADAI
jgi:hypothetical protein